MEDFSSVYTVEVYGEKGWEVTNKCYDRSTASQLFATFVNTGLETRVTSPKESVLKERHVLHTGSC